MEIYTNGTAKISHNNSGKIFDIESDELEWEAIGGEERGMGESTTYEAKIEHDDLGTLAWTLVEYPVGAENMQSTETNGHKLIKDFDFGLRHTPDD